MSEAISGWINRWRTRSYEPVSNPANNMPGAFQDHETVTPDATRNTFNSEAVNNALQAISNGIQLILIKPMIYILVLSFRILAQFFNTIYFKGVSDEVVIHDPIDKVNKFIRDLEDNLTPQQLASETDYLPPFFQGSYTQALYMATNRAKFLFVYLTNPQNENSSTIFKKIVTNPDFISLFNKRDVIIWGGDLTNPEAYQLANTLNVTKFPFLGMLCLTRSTAMTPQGPVKTSPKISLVLKLQGGINDDGNAKSIIQNKFMKKIGRYDEELSLIRNELRDKFMSQVLLKQQELNYQASLAKDQAKKKEKANEAIKKQYLVWRAEYFRGLQTNTEGAKLAIKLPSGIRKTVVFPADNKVEDIFTYVELQLRGYLDDPNITSTLTEEEAASKFDDIKIDYKFKLSSPLPPRKSLNDQRDKVIRDVDLVYPNGLLMVEDQ